MKYYALQVKTRSENKFIKLFKRQNAGAQFPLHFPQRSLNVRKNGVVRQQTAPIFPGYVFAEVASREELLTHQWAFRRMEYFYRFLRSNQKIVPLANTDLQTVLHFVKNAGPVAGSSKVYFNEDSRIVVVEGPLLGLEGKIIKVDKRKGRAKIKLDLYQDSFAVDLAFEVIAAQ